MKEIPLSQGKVAIIDDEDFERVSQFKWSAFKDKNRTSFYAKRNIITKDGKQKNIWLHRFIMNAPVGFEVDHKNHNGLDNRKENLRLATKQQNRCNAPRKAKSNVPFRGVVHYNKSGRFAAQIGFNGKCTFLGSFDTAEEAARAYDAKAKELHGDFAVLNFS